MRTYLGSFLCVQSLLFKSSRLIKNKLEYLSLQDTTIENNSTLINTQAFIPLKGHKHPSLSYKGVYYTEKVSNTLTYYIISYKDVVDI